MDWLDLTDSCHKLTSIVCVICLILQIVFKYVYYYRCDRTKILGGGLKSQADRTGPAARWLPARSMGL